MITQNQKIKVEVRIFSYDFQTTSSEYILSGDSIGHFKIPELLKIDSIRNENTIRAEKFIRGTERADGSYKFQTGLRQINPFLFYGDYFEFVNGVKKNSFILFQFCENRNKLTIHFFEYFTLYPRSRGKFISDYLKSLCYKKREHQ